MRAGAAENIALSASPLSLATYISAAGLEFADGGVPPTISVNRAHRLGIACRYSDEFRRRMNQLAGLRSSLLLNNTNTSTLRGQYRGTDFVPAELRNFACKNRDSALGQVIRR